MNNILIIRLSSLGDIILTEPIVRIIKNNYNDSKITFITKHQYVKLLELFDCIDETITFNSDNEFPQLLSNLRKKKFDLVVDLHNNIRSRRICNGLKVKRVTYKKEWLKRILAVKFKFLKTKPSPAIKRYSTVLSKLNIDKIPDTPQLNISDKYLSSSLHELEQRNISDRFYIIAAAAKNKTKMTPFVIWKELSEKIYQKNNIKALILGSPDEKQTLEECAKMLGEYTCGVFTDEDICNSVAIISKSSFVLSNDSGIAHLAAGLGKPVISLFGPTHPQLGFAPIGERASAYTINEPCSPCSLHGKKECSRDQRYCFTKMKVDDIINNLKLDVDL